MGWKSTITVSRQDCIEEIENLLKRADNETLGIILEDLTDGEGPTGEAKWWGHNFIVSGNRNLCDKCGQEF